MTFALTHTLIRCTQASKFFFSFRGARSVMPHHVSRMLLSLRTACRLSESPEIAQSATVCILQPYVMNPRAPLCAQVNRIIARRENLGIPASAERYVARSREMWPIKFRGIDRTLTLYIRALTLSSGTFCVKRVSG